MKHAQLWKRILNEGFENDYIFEDDSNYAIETRILRAPIVCSSVTFADLPTTPLADMTGISPPFTEFWIEGFGESEQDSRWGGLVESVKDENGWTMTCHNFIASPRRVFLEGAGRWRINDLGTPVPQVYCNCNEDRIEALGEISSNICVSMAGIVCDNLRLLACKNVSLEPRNCDADIQRDARKKLGVSGYRYHVLVVRPPGARKDSPAVEIGIMPRHICRGHFAEYGPEFNKGLLFGKYSGRFYIPPHMKGDKKNGVVEKDYEIPVAVASGGDAGTI